jgi:hypothetical protein
MSSARTVTAILHNKEAERLPKRQTLRIAPPELSKASHGLQAKEIGAEKGTQVDARALCPSCAPQRLLVVAQGRKRPADP